MQTKKNILMVYPKIPTTYWSFEHAMPFVEEKTLMPPLGLVTVAAMLPKHYEVRLIDLNIEEITVRDIEAADLVFVSAMIVQKESFTQVVHLCNECEVPVVAGGPYPTTSYEEIEGVDHFILNEGEITLPRFIEDYEKGTPQKLYMDITKPDITKTPVPRFDLLDMKAYTTMALQNSRGCPFNCEFCDIIEMFGRVPRYKEPQQFITEMQALYDLGYRGPLFIVDDNFIGNKRKVKELLLAIISWQKDHAMPYTFFTEASINLAQDEELMDLMVDARFDMVFVGLETPDESILKETQKQQNVRSNLLDSVKIIQSKGIEVMAGFILGFDNEPADIFDRQIHFIQQAGIPMAMLGLMLALPNTQLYRRLEKEGRLLGATSGNNTHDIELNFIPTMPKEILIDGYKRVISEIYRPKNYFDRIHTMMTRFPRKRLVYENTSVTWRDIKALLKSIWKQGFSRYGFHYFRSMFRALKTNSSEFTLWVTLAIKGYHFFIMTSDIKKRDAFVTGIEHSIKAMEEKLATLFKMENGNVFEKMQLQAKIVLKNIDKTYKKLSKRLQKDLYTRYIELRNSCEISVTQWQNKVHERKQVALDAISAGEY